MTISPVTFITAAPIRAIDKVERVKRRPKSTTKDEASGPSVEPASQPMHAATSAEELASDDTRGALLNIRLGG